MTKGKKEAKPPEQAKSKRSAPRRSSARQKPRSTKPAMPARLARFAKSSLRVLVAQASRYREANQEDHAMNKTAARLVLFFLGVLLLAYIMSNGIRR